LARLAPTDEVSTAPKPSVRPVPNASHKEASSSSRSSAALSKGYPPSSLKSTTTPALSPSFQPSSTKHTATEAPKNHIPLDLLRSAKPISSQKHRPHVHKVGRARGLRLQY
jgi:hypothetical protein